MQVLDYIRIINISNISRVSSDTYNVTFNIVYSHDSAFKDPKRGVFTINLSDFVEVTEISHQEIEEIAFCLTGHILVRGKEKDGAVTIFHLLGMKLSDWLAKNVLCNFKTSLQ